MIFHWAAIPGFIPALLRGAELTLLITVSAVLIGIAIGIVVAGGRVSRFWILRFLSGVYVEFLRNTPALLQIFIIFFGRLICPHQNIYTLLELQSIGTGKNGHDALTAIRGEVFDLNKFPAHHTVTYADVIKSGKYAGQDASLQFPQQVSTQCDGFVPVAPCVRAIPVSRLIGQGRCAEKSATVPGSVDS